MAQPSDLQSPVAADAQRDTINNILPSEAKQIQLPNNVAEDVDLPEDQQRFIAQNETIPGQGVLEGALQKVQGSLARSPLADFDEKFKAFDENLPSDPSFSQRAIVGLGRTQEQEMEILRDILGEKNEGELVRLDDNGDIQFRENTTQGFKNFDEEEITLKDIADFSGIGIELTADGATQALGTALVALSAPSSAGTSVVPGMIATQAAAGAVGTAAREAALRTMTNVKTDGQTLLLDAAMNGAVNNLSLGAVAIGRGLKESIKKTVVGSKFNRQILLAKMRKGFDDLMDIAGISSERDAARLGGELAGEQGALRQARKDLGENVGKVIDAAVAASDDAPVAVNPILDKLEDLIQKNGGKIDKDGKAVFHETIEVSEALGSGSKEELAQRQNQLFKTLGTTQAEVSSAIANDPKLAASIKRTQVKTPRTPFSDPDNGKQAMRQLTDLYNTLNALQQADGGIPLSVLNEQTQVLQALAEFNEKGFTRERTLAAFGELSSVSSEARNAAVVGALRGSGLPEEEFAEEAFRNFAEKVGPTDALITLFDKSKGSEAFVESLIQPKNANRIRQMKQALTPEQFTAVREDFLGRTFEKFIDSKTGVVDAQKFAEELDKFGPEVLDELGLGQGFRNQVKAFAKRAENISTKGIVKSDPIEGESLVLDMIRLGFYSTIEAQSRITLRMIGNSQASMKKLTQETLPRLAQEQTFEQALKTNRLIRTLKFVIGDSVVAKNKFGDEIIVPSARSRILMGLPLKPAAAPEVFRSEKPISEIQD